MNTIVEAKESVANLWGKQAIKEQARYRLLKYLLQINEDGQVLLYNVVTGKFVVLSKDEADIIKELPSVYNPKMEALVTEHFLVPEDYDEYKSVKQLRAIFQRRSSDDVVNHYIILPTTFCNARCFYCYESDYPRVHMTEETANRLIDFIDEHHGDKRVRLSWFGGEPLVGMARIDQITQGLRNREIPYTSSMISNGYLFDEKIVKKSVSLWNLKRIQITLDGREETYNRVKDYINPIDNPYHRVLKNIDLLSEAGVEVNIRLNADLYNEEDIRLLIEELGTKYSNSKYKNVSVYLNILFNDQGYEPVHHTIEDIIKLSKINDEHVSRLVDLNIGHYNISLPSLKCDQCMADNSHALMIQPDGSFTRCEHESIKDSYGSLDKGIWDYQKVLDWKEIIERSENCPECCVYPDCYLLKGCMNANYPCIDSFRLRTIRLFEDLLRTVFINNRKERKNEDI